MIKEFEKIPQEVYAEAEKYGVFRDAVQFALRADKNRDGVLCDNWLLITDGEILSVGGINLVVPSENARRHSQNRLAVKFGKISVESLDRAKLCEFGVEKQISELAFIAYDREMGAYRIITKASFACLDDFSELCELLCPEEKPDAAGDGGLPDFQGPDRMPGNPPETPPPGGGAPPGGGQRPGKKKDGVCPKCGRRYPNPATDVCPYCQSKMSVIKTLMRFAGKYKLSIILIFVSMALVSALAVISPYISSQFFYDNVLTEGGEFYGQVLFVIGLIVGLKILSLTVEMVSNVIQARVVPKIVYDLKKTIFLAIEKMSLSFFTNRRTGALMNQVNGDANTIYWFFIEGFPYLVINIIQTVAVLFVIFSIDYRLALIAVAFCPIAVFAMRYIFLKLRKLHARRYAASRSMTGVLSDVLAGARVVKAFAKEQDEVNRFGKKSDAEALSSRKVSIFSNSTFPLIRFLFSVSGTLGLAFGGYLIIKGDMTYGRLLAFIAYVGMLYSPLEFFVNITDSITNCFNATFRLMTIMESEPDIKERENPVCLEKAEGRVTFENVSFGYDKSRKVIHHVSFDIPPGESIGIVGHTGAGKSTLVNLLTRLYDPDEGRILIDGIDVRDLSFKTVRDNIAIVSQETYLFHGTVLENIRYAKPGATTDEVITAAKIAGAHDFIMKLPDGYETKIGWGNTELSGGERQRVSIARALLKNPKILILDEATSAMDTKTERAIQAALEKLCRGRTTIMIAHRLSTLRGCKKLFVIEDGKVTEEGSHSELIQKKGTYFKLYSLQYEALKNAGVEE